ncbi:hypothetical protein HYC85_015564 [Camellia sinensis]|uniref:Uncharacterized protein n=1 Tax=Camellia sinensis TaxID=4442 RepID=A0A7J7H0V2_CAMSI|nr:hypothetical protein HYC85_015564 [Camellia sinensis]
MIILISSIFGTIISAIVCLIAERDLNAWKLRLDIELLAIGFFVKKLSYAYGSTKDPFGTRGVVRAYMVGAAPSNATQPTANATGARVHVRMSQALGLIESGTTSYTHIAFWLNRSLPKRNLSEQHANAYYWDY